MDLDAVIRVVSPAALFIGSLVGFAGWLTSRRTQLYQNSKAELDTLLAAAEKSSEDAAYKKFLDDIRKEKLASLAFGCSVPLEEIGSLMRYYAQGFGTIGQIRLAWPHRNLADGLLSFRPRGWDKAMLIFGSFYSLACLLVGSLFGVVVLFLPSTVSRWHFAPQVACYFVFAALTFWVNRSLFVAHTLSKRENLPSDHQREPSVPQLAGE